MRLLCSVGPASGDAVDTAADTADTSTIVVATNIAPAVFAARVMCASRALACGRRRHTGDAGLGLRMLSCVGALEAGVAVRAHLLHRTRTMARVLVDIYIVRGARPVRSDLGVNKFIHSSESAY